MQNRLAAIVLVMLSVLSAPAPAWAQQGGDIVVLKNGGMLRGTVVAIEPGNEVTILVLGTNAPRTLPWTDVERVDRAQAPAAALPPVAGPPLAPAPAEPGPGAPRLHIRSDNRDVTLYQDDGVTTRPVCPTPCDRVIDGRVGQSFYFGGEGVASSPRFQLATESGSLDAHVAAGRSGALSGGALMVVFGGLGVISGLPLLLLAAAEKNGSDASDPTWSTMEVGGGISAGAGAAMLGGGLLLILLAGRTKFELLPSGQEGQEAAQANDVTPWPALTARGLRWTF